METKSAKYAIFSLIISLNVLNEYYVAHIHTLDQYTCIYKLFANLLHEKECIQFHPRETWSRLKQLIVLTSCVFY